MACLEASAHSKYSVFFAAAPTAGLSLCASKAATLLACCVETAAYARRSTHPLVRARERV